MVHIMNSKYCYHIVLEKNGIQKEEIGFWDTGNGLYTPWTREPVCITEHKYVREFFSEEEYNKQELLLQLKDHVPTCREKIVWIPSERHKAYFQVCILIGWKSKQKNKPFDTTICL